MFPARYEISLFARARFVSTGQCTVACVNTKTSLYTPVESLDSAFDMYHQNVKFGSASTSHVR